MEALERLHREVLEADLRLDPVRIGGVVTEVGPSAYRVAGLSRYLKLGDVVALDLEDRTSPGEVVKIDMEGVTVKSFDARVEGGVGNLAFRARPLRLKPHHSWKGRVINALGAPIDGEGPLMEGERSLPIDAEPPAAMRRERVQNADPQRRARHRFLHAALRGSARRHFRRLGRRQIDAARHARGRRRVSTAWSSRWSASAAARCANFWRRRWATIGVSRSPSFRPADESAMMRRLAPKTAMTIAEYLRDRGESVLLIVDSITRFAHAARDVALAAGEPAVARGYAPSVFTELPKLLERAGPGEIGGGAITGVFSVLVDGDDHNDPVADNIRGTLDGHIVLDRAIADQARYPAVNVLSSVSRLAHHVWTKEQRALVMRLRAMIARFESSRDLRLMGGYQAGSDPLMDQAVGFTPKIYEAMNQSREDPPSVDAFRELANALQSDKPAG